MQEKILLCALVGLIGAINNNGKKEDTDKVILEALLFIRKKANATQDEIEEERKRIYEEKFKISPDCATCKAPCGNTSDYDINEFFGESEEIRELKEKMISLVLNLAEKIEKVEESELPVLIYKSIAYFGYDLKSESYKKIINELEKLLK